MIILKSNLFANLTAAGSTAGLKTALQQAIMLEHATIPTYLYALYSIKPDCNAAIQRLLLSIVMEEMLHMSLACNILNAIGGTPVIDDPTFLPQYPGPLPGSVEGGLIVPLQAFSLPLVQDIFMVIEEPEHRLNFKLTAFADPPLTIGRFYDAMKQQIIQLGDGIFADGSPARQLTLKLGALQVFPVTNVASAVQAIDLIVQQGEGTSTSPLDPQHEPAHYYRFEQMCHGKTLAPNPAAPPNAPEDEKYTWAPPLIPFEKGGVWPVIDNPKAPAYPPGSAARRACDTFNYTYTTLLKSLHAAFNGEPGLVQSTVGVMESLRQQAMEMVTIDMGNGTHAGPSFEYNPVNPG